ncbi:hypothetical protein BT93_K2328 [Corymbia citriodora subsp. variegata]|nr:hypothetical protein BT93_K2328 [Corymbia citriodora subsp. variegata]
MVLHFFSFFDQKAIRTMSWILLDRQIQEIGDQLERSLSSVRARKAQLFNDQIQHLRAKERSLKEENAKLLAKCHENPWWSTAHPRAAAIRSQSSRSTDVEIRLLVGLLES